MSTRKIVLKKVVVGTPIRSVTSGSFAIGNLGGVSITGQSSGTLLAYNGVSGNYEPVLFTGDSNMFLTFDSGGNPDTMQINFKNDSISGHLIPKLDSAFDLGSSTKKWRDLHLSGSTINLGDLTIKSTGGGIEIADSDGNTLLQNIKFITVNGDTDILSYDSNTSTFTFNDSDIARTDENETFHKNVTIAGDLTVGGTTTTVNSETINLADNKILINSNATGSPSEDGGIEIERGDAVNKSFNWDETNDYWTIGGEKFQTTGHVQAGKFIGDSGVIGGITFYGSGTLITTGRLYYANVFSTEGDLPSASTYHGMFAHVHATGKGYFAHAGAWHKLMDMSSANDSATITNLANTTLTGKNATLDSAHSRQLSADFLHFDSALGDSATITNIANSVLTAKAITGTSIDVDSAQFTNLSATNFVFAGTDSATITNLASTTLTGSQMDMDSAEIRILTNTNLLSDSATITNLAATALNVDQLFIDSGTIGNLANTQLTSSQITSDSATINTLNVDSSDIRQFSTEFINFDSAFGDSATITNIANSTFTGKVITGTNVSFDSARIGSIGIGGTDITTSGKIYYANVFSTEGDLPSASSHHGMFAHVHATGKGYFAHGGAWHQLLDKSSANDSATITNLANTQLTGSQATLDSATITKLNADSSDIRQFSTEFINFDSAFGDSATITNIATTQLTVTNANIDSANITNLSAANFSMSSGDSATITNIANSTLTAKVITNTTLVGDSATITNIANDVLTAKAITNTSQVGDSATITNIASNSINTNALQVDDITIDGSTISDTGDLVIDAEGDITLDANGGDILFKDNGTLIGTVGGFSTSNVIMKSEVSDKDIIFRGNRGGTEITVLTLDMSDMGTAIFTAGGTFARRTEIVSDSDYQLKIANSSAIWFNRVQGDGTFAIHKNGVGNIFHATGSGVGVTGDAAVSGTLTVGNLNVDSADIIKISRDNLAAGTGVTYDSSTGNISIGQALGTSDSAVLGGLTITGNLTVGGTTVTQNQENLTTSAQLLEVATGRTGTPTGDAGLIIEMGNDSNAFIGFDQTLGKFIISRTNATGTSTGNLVHTTAPLVVGGLTADSANITQITGTLQTAAQPNVTSLGTLTALTVDDITIDGSTISDAGDFTLNVEGDITLDANGADIKLSDDNLHFGTLSRSVNDLVIKSPIQDGDVTIKGNDGGSEITAVTFDMSDAGKATFNNEAVIPKIDADSADITTLTGDSAVFSSAIQTPKITTPFFTFDSDRFNVGGTGVLNFIAGGNFRMGVNKSANIGSEGVTADHALAVKGDIYALDRSAGYSIELIPDQDPVQFRADNRTGSGFAGIDFVTGNGNPANDQTRMQITTSGKLNVQGDMTRTSGDMTFDMPANITLDADGGSIKLSDGGTQFGELLNSSSDFVIESKVQDKDIIFKGDDGGSGVTALTLDMSEAGKATFNSDIITSGTIRAGNLNVDSADIITIARSNISGRNGLAYNSSTGVFDLDSANAITTAKNALSTGSPDALTYDSAAGQFALNANHVMALIQTVDSNTSGLNADKLDGQHGAYYRINVYDSDGTLLN